MFTGTQRAEKQEETMRVDDMSPEEVEELHEWFTYIEEEEYAVERFARRYEMLDEEMY